MTSVPSGETGILWWRIPGDPNQVFLVVKDGRVIDCPAHAESWAKGQTSDPILERGGRLGAQVEWVPLNSVPTRRLAHLVDRTRLRHWATRHDRGIVSTLEFGQCAEGWTLDDGTEPHLWIYPDRNDAVGEVRRRLAVGTWWRVPASYDAAGRPKPDPELPVEWGVPD